MDLVKILFRQRDTERTRIPECDANGSVYVVGGVGGGPATIADGADIAQGALADVEVAVAGPASVIAILKRIRTLLNGGLPASLGQKTKAASLPVTLASDEDALAVTGTFFQVTQPVSVADGSDVTQGANADAAITADLAGTASSKLRGLVKWAYERMPASLGQKTKLLSLPVTLASDEDALAVTGTVDIEVGGVPPQLDDTDKIAVSVYGEDAAAGDTPMHVDGTYGVRVCHPNATSGTVDADPDVNNAPLTDVGNVLRYWTRNFVFNGATWDRLRGDTSGMHVSKVPAALQGPGNPVVDSYTSVAVDLAASGANQVLVAAPGANKQIWVYGLFMMADTAAGTVTLQDEDDTALSGTMAVSDEGGWVLPMSGNFAMPWIKIATNKALEADTGACTVDGIITYAIVSV